MEIRYLRHKEIDIAKWENCVRNSLNCCVYAHAWYLDMLSLGWDAFVMDDYDAVMPIFADSTRMYMPKGMVWTGIYGIEVPDKEVCQAFVDAIDRYFKYVDIQFDKYFVRPSYSVGRFTDGYVYQVDTIHGLYSSKVAKLLSYNVRSKLEDYMKMFDCVNHTYTTVKNISCNDFINIQKSMPFREAIGLKNIAQKSVAMKFGYYTELHNSSNNTMNGASLAVFSDNYIFLPFFGVVNSAGAELYCRVYLLCNMVNHYFKGRPGIFVIDSHKVGIAPDLLKEMGFEKYSCSRYRVDMVSKITNLFTNNNKKTQISKI